MLIIASISLAWPTVVIGVLGFVGILTTALVLIFGSRARIVTDQQGKAIDALEARLTVVEAENAELKTRESANNALLLERDARITALQNQLETLKGVVTQAANIEALRNELQTSHHELLSAIGKFK